MKKLLLLAIAAGSITAYALPTYEPFTEFAPVIAANPITLIATTNVGGGALGSLANSSIPNCIDLATGGYTAPGGEHWGSLNFSGTGGTGLYKGLDIAVISDPTIFPESALSSLLPSTFPGYPASGGAITNFAENPAQPLIWNGTAFAQSPNIVGNSAVLKFSQPITRPTSGTRTVYVSYLLSVVQQGALGSGNDGRYMAFLSQTNLVEGTGSGGAYTTWASLFNTYNGATAAGVHYASHGLLLQNTTSFYIGACDSAAGKTFSTTSFTSPFNSPHFVVGAYLLNSGANKDTNAVWVNPSLASFGGANPPFSPIQIYAMPFNMSDIGGLVLIDRVGSGASGGVGTNYIANLLVGTTWSYVTGGPEFTNAPVNADILGYGGTVTLSGAAVAAAQSVSYYWQRISGGVTNNLTDGVGTAGGGATVSGSATRTLTLTGVTAGDVAGSYQLVATASGTGFSLPAQVSIIYHTDPFISANPANATVSYGGKATFTATASTAQASLSYHWYHGATPLADGVQGDGSTVTGSSGTVAASALTTSLTLSNVTYLEAGNYSLWVTNNTDNAVFSTPATLIVNDPVIVTQPPYSVVVPLGGTNTISVVAAGSGVTYQWYNTAGQVANGGDFSGVTSSTLKISNAHAEDANNYYVIVGGTSGVSVQSSNVAVFVNSTALGPFTTNDWPTSIANNSVVDYVIYDGTLSSLVITPPGWNNVLSLAAGGDQTIATRTLNGLTGRQATGSYFNFADPNWTRFANIPQIDILLLINGDSTIYNSAGNGLSIQYSYGQVPTTTTYVGGGRFPLGANNGQWNWMLLSVTNLVDQFGYRTVGDTSFSGSGGFGGINAGTIRMGTTGTSWPAGAGPTIAAAAIGPRGAFGTSNQVNRFWSPVNCSPQPANNLAYIDFNQNLTNHLSVMNDPNVGETYIVQSGVGPAEDLRTAIQSTSGIMEFPILNNYLGYPCNENLVMQLCLEVYDDPAMAGTQLGPFQYATDSQGDLATYLGQYYTLTGSGQWLKLAFYVGPANLQGVNTAPLTGGPTVYFPGVPPFISRVELGVIRNGTNALAGQIPDPSYYIAPLVTCSSNYGYYAEWYPSQGIANNLGIPGNYNTINSVGPSNDQRIAEEPIPAGQIGYYYEQFTLLNNAFGPAYQDNSDVIISVDYYDDPALVNGTLYPNTYNTLNNGVSSVISPQSPYGTAVVLTGSGKWKTATWELPNVNFTGAYVCRFASIGPVYISRARFNVIRPCGPFLGIDYLQSLGMTNANPNLQLNWRGTAALQAAAAVTGVYDSVANVTNTVTNTFTVPMTNNARFFRLEFPGYPTYLSPYSP